MSVHNISKKACPKCREVFSRERDVERHLKKNTNRCRDIAARYEAEKQLTIIQENNKKVVENLVNTRAQPKDRQRVVENIEAQGKILRFEDVVRKTKIPQDVLRTTVELMADGDIMLFRRIFIDHVEPHLRCIRVKDFAREKYEFFDGDQWVVTTLTNVVDMFANALYDKYRFLVDEKCKKVKAVDRKYHARDDSEKIAKKLDNICMEYANVTEHVTKLSIQDPDFMNEIKRGIRGFLAQPPVPNSKKKKQVEPAFEYNEESEEIESISADSEEINEVFLEDHHIMTPVLRMMGIHIEL